MSLKAEKKEGKKIRRAGVLLPISSLMGEFGIGDMGAAARYFVDFINQMGFSVWQILPITILGPGNSPYSGISAYAGNSLLIDISALAGDLLSREEISTAKIDSPFQIRYDLVRANKERLLRLAASRISDKEKQKINQFVAENSFWLNDYALYMAIRDSNGLEWSDWNEHLKKHDNKALEEFAKDNIENISYYYFEQFLFYKQWFELKKYANDMGVKIFGDMPIYVTYNSPDVWTHPNCFQLKKDLKPAKVAGVPPDYFAADGQLWGNPLYDYEFMKDNNYEWFTQRIKFNSKLYDILRIDHFRGFCEYWAVSAGAQTAKEGIWLKGPGMDFWNHVKRNVPNLEIVAEDLGIIDQQVEKFLKESGFPGMRVMQFAFDGNSDNPHLPYNYETNSVAYTATHDNNTTLGWLYSLSDNTRQFVLDYLNITDADWGEGGRNCKSTKSFAKEIISSSAFMAIILFQDLCGYGADTRINVPGVPDGNWEFRCTLSSINEIDTDFYRRINTMYGRIAR